MKANQSALTPKQVEKIKTLLAVGKGGFFIDHSLDHTRKVLSFRFGLDDSGVFLLSVPNANEAAFDAKLKAAMDLYQEARYGNKRGTCAHCRETVFKRVLYQGELVCLTCKEDLENSSPDAAVERAGLDIPAEEMRDMLETGRKRIKRTWIHNFEDWMVAALAPYTIEQRGHSATVNAAPHLVERKLRAAAAK